VYVAIFSLYLKKYDLNDSEYVMVLLANSIMAVFFAGASSSIRLIRSNLYFLKEILNTAIPGIILALLTLIFIVEQDWYNKQTFTWVFCALLLLMALKLFRDSQSKESTVDQINISSFWIAGSLSGFISALSGLGGGVVVVPFLSGIKKMKLQKASAISLGIMPYYTLAMSIYYLVSLPENELPMPYTVGYIAFPMLLPCALGVIMAAPFGIKLAQRMKNSHLKLLFTLLLLVVITKMLYGLK